MKKLLVLSVVLLSFWGYGWAQQGVQYTQFMFNKLTLNPAYASTAEGISVAGLYRAQWVGIEGAPTSQAINAMMPFPGKRVGLGVSIDRDIIGPSQSWNFRMMYSYSISLDGKAKEEDEDDEPKKSKGKIGIGIQAAIRSYKVDWDKVDATESNDQLILDGDSKKTLPNIGFGIYYQNDKFYVGISIPTLIRGDLSGFNYELDGNSDYGREERHYYFMAGTIFKISDKLKLKPAVLAKYVKGTPFDIDLHASLIIFEKFWTGLTYRFGGIDGGAGESLALIFQYQVMPAFRFGISYDYSLSEVQKQHSGTYELMLEYTFPPKKGKASNPRYF